jgi:hypothetical protein
VGCSVSERIDVKEIWTGRVEVLTSPTEFGDTKAFTNVVTWAADAEGYKQRIASVFEEYGWTLTGVEESSPIAKHESLSAFDANARDRAIDNPEACIYGTFHYYPSKSV